MRALIWVGLVGLVACVASVAVRFASVRSARASADAAFEAERARAGEMVDIPARRGLPPFSIDKTEVTVAAYRGCVQAGACSEPTVGGHCTWGKPGSDGHPVNCVDHRQATAFCAWAGRRLPTKDEWKAAACGEERRKFPWGEGEIAAQDCFARHMHWEGPHSAPRLAKPELGTCPAGAHPAGATPEGVLGFGGNVAEWTSSELSESGGPSNRFIVLGPSWIVPTRVLGEYACKDGVGQAPTYRDSLLGFRCARGAERPLFAEVVDP